ncbi:MAG TPA: hypothetical protein VFE17_05315 [Candidatus Baltobacteraceae bacterium]|nr:hypothetical protein [Candidatus Baltobacteraceae bacterium]
MGKLPFFLMQSWVFFVSVAFRQRFRTFRPLDRVDLRLMAAAPPNAAFLAVVQAHRDAAAQIGINASILIGFYAF